jgi:hypothetical protein
VLAIDLQGSNDTLLVTGGATNILGKIDDGIGTNIAIFSPGAGESFSYAGEIANFASVVVESGIVTFLGPQHLSWHDDHRAERSFGALWHD